MAFATTTSKSKEREKKHKRIQRQKNNTKKLQNYCLSYYTPQSKRHPPPPPKKRKKKPSLKMIGCCVKDSKKPDGWCITVTGWPIVWTIGYWKHLSNKENVLHVLKTYLLSSNNASSHQTKPVLEQNNCAFWVKIQLAMFAKY